MCCVVFFLYTSFDFVDVVVQLNLVSAQLIFIHFLLLLLLSNSLKSKVESNISKASSCPSKKKSKATRDVDFFSFLLLHIDFLPVLWYLCVVVNARAITCRLFFSCSEFFWCSFWTFFVERRVLRNISNTFISLAFFPRRRFFSLHLIVKAKKHKKKFIFLTSTKYFQFSILQFNNKLKLWK